MKTFSILITTKSRKEDLKFTLQKINHLIQRDDVECIICDDGSKDSTFNFVKGNYPTIRIIQNKKSKGLIFSRNRLLELTTAKYAISLDDDAHFITENPLEIIEKYFITNQKCAVIACRIFWGKQLPNYTETNEEIEQVRGFVGCGHVWNMKAWNDIPNYPDWFVFYGEEEFASFKLFNKGWEIDYNPQLFVQHRVNVQSRKN
ncbi:MAG: glycosyltransferase, partial [Urechidicola sp.]|nr:glycosyltransferase [Urechidicola sp.]